MFYSIRVISEVVQVVEPWLTARPPCGRINAGQAAAEQCIMVKRKIIY